MNIRLILHSLKKLPLPKRFVFVRFCLFVRLKEDNANTTAWIYLSILLEVEFGPRKKVFQFDLTQ